MDHGAIPFDLENKVKVYVEVDREEECVWECVSWVVGRLCIKNKAPLLISSLVYSSYNCFRFLGSKYCILVG